MDDICKEAFELANDNLPRKIHEDITIYLLFGIRGTGIALGNEIAIDLCDEFIINDGNFNKENLTQLIAHEIHHVDMNEIIEININKNNTFERKKINFLGELISEGVAYKLFKMPINPNGNLWQSNLKRINQKKNK